MALRVHINCKRACSIFKIKNFSSELRSQKTKEKKKKTTQSDSVNSANNGSTEMEIGFPNGGRDGDHNDVVVAELSQSFAMQDVFNLKRSHTQNHSAIDNMNIGLDLCQRVRNFACVTPESWSTAPLHVPFMGQKRAAGTLTQATNRICICKIRTCLHLSKISHHAIRLQPVIYREIINGSGSDLAGVDSGGR